VISLVWTTAAGERAAHRLASAWPGECTVHSGPVADQVRTAWRSSDAIVAFLATGATVRLVAPLLGDKRSDPGVVCVDEAGRYAVALLGGHGGGANDLARRAAAVLGAEPVITTATDSAGVTPLDSYGADLGFHLATPDLVAPVTRALLDGSPVTVHTDTTWPLPPLPGPLASSPSVPAASAADSSVPGPFASTSPVPAASAAEMPPGVSAGGIMIEVTDRVGVSGGVLLYRPPSLVVGVGASRGAPADEIAALVDETLVRAGLAVESVRALATVEAKAGERGIVALAEARGWPLLTYPAAALAGVEVPNPSEVVRAAVGTPSVAEAAALHAARRLGRAAELVAPKRASATATAAVARLAPRGRLTIVGLGPGAADLRTPRATAALRRAGTVVGLDQYVDQVRHLLRPGTRVLPSGLGAEEERARTAVELATRGHAVALVGSGDAGVYAMASPALEMAGVDVDVEAVPGVTAALAAAALLGAPLGHDHAYVSLSDLHTPWPAIVARLRAVAAADLVACLYNPRSGRRTAQFDEAMAIFGEHRPAGTPVGLVRDASRPAERVTATTLARLDPSMVDMNTVVLVGSSQTRIVAGRMVTPRGYRWLS